MRLDAEERAALKKLVSEKRAEIAARHWRVEKELARMANGGRVRLRKNTERASLVCGIDGCEFSTFYGNSLTNHRKFKHKKVDEQAIWNEIAEIKKKLDELDRAEEEG